MRQFNGVQAHVCARVSWVMGVRSVGYTGSRMYPRQLGRWDTSVLLSIARLSCVRLCCYRQLHIRLPFYSLSIDAQQEGTRRATEALDNAFAEKFLGLRVSC